MADREHLHILLKGADEWNSWRAANAEVTPDLREGNLSGVRLGRPYSRANLRQADLQGAVLRDAVLDGVTFGEAKLNGADLSGARLIGTILSLADLSDATLEDSILNAANFREAIVKRTNFSGARIGWTVFGSNDLSEAIGLESVVHSAPSTIGIDTVYQSKGKIPKAFLRGAGVPENFITYMRTLTGTALDFYTVFISYSTRDQAFADQLYADLQARGVRCWFAPHDLKGGRKVHEQIDEAIRAYDKLLLILSEASMTSNWVKTEVANARAREARQHRQMLFPIAIVPFERIRSWRLFDADTGMDSAREIREYLILDFSEWAHRDSYQRALDRLVRDLEPSP